MSKRTRAAAFGAATTALAAGLGAYPVFFRRWCLTWGARPDEVSIVLRDDQRCETIRAAAHPGQDGQPAGTQGRGP